MVRTDFVGSVATRGSDEANVLCLFKCKRYSDYYFEMNGQLKFYFTNEVLSEIR